MMVNRQRKHAEVSDSRIQQVGLSVSVIVSKDGRRQISEA